MNYVIGSGPAGVSAAAALVEQGQPVTMLDAGGDLEPALASTALRLASRPVDEWTSADRESVRGPLRFNAEGAPLKLAFGSDYAYRDVDRLLPVEAHGVDAYRSLATGGLSVLWGAAILPFSDTDFSGWPVGAADMAAHYAAALRMTGLAGEHDGLARTYPLYIEPTTRMTPSRQARLIAERMARNAAELERQSIHFGAARLAITRSPGAVAECVRCAMCLYGCPYGLIYSTRATVQALRAVPGFSYQPGLLVRRLTERHADVAIDAVTRDTLEPRRFEASRVYLAAGALASTAILLESLPARPPAMTLRQSDHFLLPLALRRSAGRMATERLHTLSQMFIEVTDAAVARHAVHLQLYTHNDFYARIAKARLGAAYALLAPIVDRVVDRLVLMKGYVHSDESAAIRVRLEPGPAGPTLRADAVDPGASDAVIRRVVALLRRNSGRIGAMPLGPGLRRGLPGSSVHVGGSFPMRMRPGDFESDTLGRPAGMTRVHVVDSTTFPTMPAAPPTLTVMANARRIALASHQQDGPCSA